MKKIISLLLVLTLVMTALVGCSKPAEPAGNPEPAPSQEPAKEPAQEPTPAEGGKIAKLGLGQNISIKSSKDAGVDANGKEVLAQGQADVTIAAVGFDKDGKIASVTIDTAQTKVAFDKDLKVASDKSATIKSKKELGPEYGMVNASGIKKEWFEQMEAFENWMIGKTVDEIKNLKVKEVNPSHQNVPDIPELTSTVTITVESYIAAVVEAWEKAVDAPGAEKVGLGVNTDIASSKDKGTDANGKEVLPLAQINTYMSATAIDKDGKVVATLIDTAQVKIPFDAEGKVTADKNAEFKTKQELKEEYGMKNASAIKKEWYEQMAAFQDWMVGKTLAEITGLKTKEANPTHKHVPDVPELTSTVTITVEGYLGVVEKAFANAR